MAKSMTGKSVKSKEKFTPFEITREGQTFLIRQARNEDLENMAWVAAEAFLDDMMMNYIAGTTESFMLPGGRTIVVEAKEQEASSANGKGGNIAAAAMWYGPRKELGNIASLRGGVLTPLWNWGLRGDPWSTEKSLKVSFGKALKQRRLKQEDAWFLQLIFTVKRFEGRAMRKSAPLRMWMPPFILDTDSERARARYLHLGFEVGDFFSRVFQVLDHLRQIIEPWCSVGVGKVDSKGCRPLDKEKRKRRDELTGFSVTCMVNVSESGLPRLA
ncbi:hypothetical protein BT96DRAFT_991796 [Gymnopus androsaceus JB14]|uniref:N-acetyltransferase domain-containing protein n=1 Tax=Gymnopus androsaceus JB14 TaxID=1447944 RepID=A0A6A4HRP7_9AGAR|nr:hypothetical protein BT96DRAFT_991796 [Gymnopus androsaceus JB14]